MSTNCLVTTLKSVVNNSELEKLGELIVPVVITSETNSDRRRLSFTFSSDAIITCDDGNKLSNNSDFSNPTDSIQYVFGSGYRTIYLLEGTYNVKILSKYKLTRFDNPAGVESDGVVNIDILKFKYCSELAQLNLNYNSKVVGDISNLPIGVTNINFTSVWNNKGNITGNIEDLSSRTNLTQILASYCQNLTGEIVNLCTEMAKLRTSGTLRLDLRNTKVTYNGTVPTSILTVTFDSSLPNGYSIQ